jgi:glycosyltransferase involved in cell wall biosynthesis
VQSPNPYLSVAIPTYNRRDELIECLRSIVPQAKRHAIRIYISDNASNYNVASVVVGFQKEHPFIYCSRNSENMGLDANVRKVISMVESSYTWVFSDDDVMVEGALDIVLPYCVEGEFAWIVPDREVRSRDFLIAHLDNSKFNDVIHPTEYKNPNSILRKYGFNHFTFIGSLIIKLEDWRRVDGQKYMHYAYFEHLCILAESLLNRKTLVLPNILLHVRSGNESYTENQWMVWVFHLPNALTALPCEYTLSARRKVLSDLVLFSARPSYFWMCDERASEKFTWKNRKSFLHSFLRLNAFSWVVSGYLALLMPRYMSHTIQKTVKYLFRTVCRMGFTNLLSKGLK